uniref:Uncharacterized protein n=1 Tax=Panagrolaimus sp. PS1159 TaxID=55785 RepID=A0AC35G949_9BILA
MLEEWELVLKCARKVMERTTNYSINFIRFILDHESREITNRNIGNVIILIIHNKLKINYFKKTKTIFLTVNSQINPMPFSELRVDNLPFCRLYNTLTDDIYRVDFNLLFFI